MFLNCDSCTEHLTPSAHWDEVQVALCPRAVTEPTPRCRRGAQPCTPTPRRHERTGSYHCTDPGPQGEGGYFGTGRAICSVRLPEGRRAARAAVLPWLRPAPRLLWQKEKLTSVFPKCIFSRAILHNLSWFFHNISILETK